MKIFLLKTVEGIGNYGDIKNISDGYAKNFLIPKKLAIEYNNLTKNDIDNRLKKLKEEIKIETKKRTELSDSIESTKLKFFVKSHDDGNLYGSIGAEEICEELKKQNINISKNQILIKKSIKKTGQHLIQIKLSNTLQPELKINVFSLEEKDKIKKTNNK